MDTKSSVYSFFLLAVLGFSLFLAWLVLRPFLHTLILATIFTTIFYPLYARFLRYYRGRKYLAVATVLGVVFFGGFIPVFFFLFGLVVQGIDSITVLSSWIDNSTMGELAARLHINEYLAWFETNVSFVDWRKITLQDSMLQAGKNVGELLLVWGKGFLADTASLVLHFFLMLFIMFYFFLDGPRLVKTLKHLSPLRPEHEEAVFRSLHVVSRSVFVGGLLTACLQGLVGGIGLWIIGVPALFWGAVLGFASLVPIVGTALVWVPVEMYLVLHAKWQLVIFFACWNILFGGCIDNFIRPMLMRGASGLSSLYLFLSIMGGVQVFGVKGLLYGPLTLSFALAMLRIYEEEYADMLLANGEGGKEGTIERYINNLEDVRESVEKENSSI